MPMKRSGFLSVLILTLALFCASAAAEVDAVNVREFGAVGDGETDDTAAFLEAVARAKEEGGHVFVPRGRYRISKPIALENVAVSGPAGGAWPADADALPSVFPTHRDGPAFHLLAAGALHSLDITYHWQEEPDNGPPAILLGGIGAYISNVRIRYAWDGILADGESNVGRANLENIFMVAIRNVGVRVTGTWDVPRLDNIEVWNAGPVARPLGKGIGFHLGKNDLIRITDCFVFAMQYGFLLEDQIAGCGIEGGTWGVMNGCATDFCGKGIVVRGAHTLSVSGGTFWNHQEGLVVDGEGARVRVTGSELKSNGAPAVVVRDCDHTIVTGCSLLRPMQEYDHAAAVLEGGRTILNGNHIQSYGPGLRVEPGIRSVVVEGNQILYRGASGIVDRHGEHGSVLVEHNLLETLPEHPGQRDGGKSP